jgi:hypothetical protein
MEERSSPPDDAVLRTLFNLLETSKKPIVASICRFAMGGGLEVALACSGRVTHAAAQLSLPELQLGLIPGWGGTQRLPRIVGVAKSLEMIVRGQAVCLVMMVFFCFFRFDKRSKKRFLDRKLPPSDWLIGWCRSRRTCSRPLCHLRESLAPLCQCWSDV